MHISWDILYVHTNGSPSSNKNSLVEDVNNARFDLRIFLGILVEMCHEFLDDNVAILSLHGVHDDAETFHGKLVGVPEIVVVQVPTNKKGWLTHCSVRDPNIILNVHFSNTIQWLISQAFSVNATQPHWLVRVLVWCWQAPSHYQNQCWLRS